jgi:hypothetical protein
MHEVQVPVPAYPVPLQVPPFVMIVNDPRTDVVSASLIKSGVWERPWVRCRSLSPQWQHDMQRCP